MPQVAELAARPARGGGPHLPRLAPGPCPRLEPADALFHRLSILPIEPVDLVDRQRARVSRFSDPCRPRRRLLLVLEQVGRAPGPSISSPSLPDLRSTRRSLRDSALSTCAARRARYAGRSTPRPAGSTTAPCPSRAGTCARGRWSFRAGWSPARLAVGLPFGRGGPVTRASTTAPWCRHRRARCPASRAAKKRPRSRRGSELSSSGKASPTSS